MTVCPQCGSSVEGLFGLSSCPSCHALLSIGLNGEAVLADSPTEGSSPVLIRPISLTDEVEDYGNSVESSGKEGLFMVQVTISGVDTPELRQSLEQALTDKKIGWDTSEIMRSMRQGKLVLPEINAAKASVVINRLKSLPIELKWAQRSLIAPVGSTT